MEARSQMQCSSRVGRAHAQIGSHKTGRMNPYRQVSVSMKAFLAAAEGVIACCRLDCEEGVIMSAKSGFLVSFSVMS